MPLLHFVELTELSSTIKSATGQSGNAACDTLRGWVVDTYPDFGEMNIIRVIKYIDVLIYPDDYLHRSILSGNKFTRVCRRILESSEKLGRTSDWLQNICVSCAKLYVFHCNIWRDHPQGIISGFAMLSSWVISRFFFFYTDDQIWTGFGQWREWDHIISLTTRFQDSSDTHQWQSHPSCLFPRHGKSQYFIALRSTIWWRRIISYVDSNVLLLLWDPFT